jgi:glutathione S-transferase
VHAGARTGSARRVLQLFQAEWCPYSSMVRERLTELGVDYVIRQVEPRPADRARLREVSGQDSIPVVVLEDGTVLSGDTDAIVAALDERLDAWEWESGHADQARAHA